MQVGMQMKKKIALITNCAETENTDYAVRIFEKIAAKFGHEFLCDIVHLDGAAGALAQKNTDTCLSSDSVLFCAADGSKRYGLPETELSNLRKALKLYSEIRPAFILPQISDSPLKSEITEKNFDIMIVNDIAGGIYYGERGTRRGKLGRESYDTECYSEIEVERAARTAFELAQKRGGKVTSVDKADCLESSRLWRYSVHEVAADYPDVSVDDMFIDEAAAALTVNPSRFDVILTSNLFGDVLSKLAATLTGNTALLPSASVNDTTLGLYAPAFSDPNLNLADPIATILSLAMMLRLSFEMEAEADTVERAVNETISSLPKENLYPFGSKNAIEDIIKRI